MIDSVTGALRSIDHRPDVRLRFIFGACPVGNSAPCSFHEFVSLTHCFTSPFCEHGDEFFRADWLTKKCVDFVWVATCHVSPIRVC